MQKAKVSRPSAERKARCGALTAEVAAFTAQLLNDQADGKFTSKYKPASIVAECMTCHSNDSHGKENCLPCHDDPHKKK